MMNRSLCFKKGAVPLYFRFRSARYITQPQNHVISGCKHGGKQRFTLVQDVELPSLCSTVCQETGFFLRLTLYDLGYLSSIACQLFYAYNGRLYLDSRLYSH